MRLLQPSWSSREVVNPPAERPSIPGSFKRKHRGVSQSRLPYTSHRQMDYTLLSYFLLAWKGGGGGVAWILGLISWRVGPSMRYADQSLLRYCIRTASSYLTFF